MSYSSSSSSSSNVVWTTQSTETTNATPPHRHRHGHILALMAQAIIYPPRPDLGPQFYHEAIHLTWASFLAFKHLEERRGDVLPYLPGRLQQSCPDFHWTYEGGDTTATPKRAIQHLLGATNTNTSTSTNQELSQSIFNSHNTTGTNIKVPAVPQHISPYAIIGGVNAPVADALGNVGSAMDIPLISGAALSRPSRDDNDLSARTVLNFGEAQLDAAILYLQSLGVTHVAIFYAIERFETALSSTFKKMQDLQGITILPITYDWRKQGYVGANQGLQKLKDSEYRYVISLSYQIESVMLYAYNMGLAGPTSGMTWVHIEKTAILAPRYGLNLGPDTNPNPMVSSSNTTSVSLALHGSVIINTHVEPHGEFDRAMREMETNVTLQQEFLNVQLQPSRLTTPAFGYTFSRRPVVPHVFQYFVYDAVIALGLAACETPGLFTGREMFDTLLQLDFDGVSGNVAFDSESQLRDQSRVAYSVLNFRVSPNKSDNTTIRFEYDKVAHIDTGGVHELLPSNSFVYADNTTNVPPMLPMANFELNMVPWGVQAFGCILAGLVMIVSLVLLVWTALNRNLFVVRAAQPAFLMQICVGTFILASAVFPFSLQAEDRKEAISRHLDAACVMTPWLVFVGFAITISALFSKTWRINTLTQSAVEMQRMVLQPKDVIKPFAALLALNVAVLTAWTIVDSYQYVRVLVDGNVDMFGRNVESYGACRSVGDDDDDDDGTDRNSKMSYYFFAPLATANLLMVLVAIYECYKARHLPAELAEVKWLSISLASFAESMIVGGPILLVAQNDPTAYFTVGSMLACISCITILVPMFLPRLMNQGIRRISSPIRRSNLPSNGSGSGVRHPSSGIRSSGFSSTDEGTLTDKNLEPGKMRIIRRHVPAH